MELLELYRRMAWARAVELALADLWARGLVSGELHLGTGEEAIAAGVAVHVGDADGVALDHRPTPVLALLGVDLASLLREMLGHPDGLCGGRGGHMHLFSREHRAASSGIVGAAGPAACGFALAAVTRRTGGVGVGFFGDGAVNQGMLMESLNLAVAWKLPAIFVCKDNGWAISTRSAEVTGGDLVARAEAFGLVTESLDGTDAEAIWEAAGAAFDRARRGRGPTFLHATCPRPDGHLLGDTLQRAVHRPVSEGGPIFGRILSSALALRGGGLTSRAASMARMTGLMLQARGEGRDRKDDPLVVARKRLGRARAGELDAIDAEVLEEIQAVVAQVVGEGGA